MQQLKRFLSSTRGSAMPIVALGIFMLIGATGVAVDMGRVQIVQTRMQNALDAAGLAVGSEASTVNITTETSKYFYANFPANYLGTTITSGPSATPNGLNSVINLSVTGTVNTTFMQLFHINSIAVSAASQITRQSSGMELVLVLDNTGSMACDVTTGSNCNSGSTSKIVALKNAVTGTNGLLDILFGGGNTVPNLWVGVVPFTDMVNIGTSHMSWMDTMYDNALDFGPSIPGSTCPSYSGTSPATAGTHSTSPSRCAYTLNGSTIPNWGPSNWLGCINARSATVPAGLSYDESDDIPSGTGTLFQAFDYASDYTGMSTSNNSCSGGSNPWNCHRSTGSGASKKTITTYDSESGANGPNLGCITTEVMGMTASKSNVVSLVNSMTANGSTMINLGMAWSWRMLSPKWRGLWGGEMDANSLPLDYHTPLMNKVVILMTDGTNSVGSSSAIGAYQGQTNPTNAQLDSKTLAVCNQLKANGVIIYTIGFGSGSDVDTSLLSSCASGPTYFFLAPTNAELQTAFQQIGDSLANLYISQ